MLSIQNINKTIKDKNIVDNISFEVPSGCISGLLGPNGAGKSTTMRIMSTFMPPTSGKVRIAGYDIDRKPMEVRKRIGYMPENNPLHLDMRVEEYLRFRAGLKGVHGDRLRKRLGEVLELKKCLACMSTCHLWAEILLTMKLENQVPFFFHEMPLV